MSPGLATKQASGPIGGGLVAFPSPKAAAAHYAPAQMSRWDLPPECSQVVDYASLIETLKLLDSEKVCLFIAAGTEDKKGSRIQAAGVLKADAYNWAERFAVGDGARVLISKSDFISAHLQNSTPATSSG